MNYSISSDKSILTISVSPEERRRLRGIENIQSDATMFDFLETLVCNSELEWIRPEETGDLTDAPILGILGEATTAPGGREVGFCGGQKRFQPVEARWAFMSYQVVSLLEVLRDKGEVELQGGVLISDNAMAAC